MRRVAKPGAPLHFIEHGRSDDERTARFQDRWNPIQKYIACGCNVNRKIDAIVTESGYTIDSLDRFLMDGAPRPFAEMYRGRATA